MPKQQPPSRTHVECPYCGTQNTVAFPRDLPPNYQHRSVETCETENGGCDRDFVFKINLKPEIQVQKIEGEDGA